MRIKPSYDFTRYCVGTERVAGEPLHTHVTRASVKKRDSVGSRCPSGMRQSGVVKATTGINRYGSSKRTKQEAEQMLAMALNNL